MWKFFKYQSARQREREVNKDQCPVQKNKGNISAGLCGNISKKKKLSKMEEVIQYIRVFWVSQGRSRMTIALAYLFLERSW